MTVSSSTALFGALLLAWAGTAGAGDHVTIFDYPGADRTGFLGVNDHGVAVGGALIFPDPFAFTLDLRTDELNVLTSPPGDVNMIANGINNAGAIVGVLLNPDGLSGPGFIRRPNATFKFFSNPDCATSTDTRAINEQGLATGSCNTAEDTTIGFMYNSKTGKFTKIAPVPFVYMHGINADGTAVGQAWVPADVDTCGGGPDGADLLEYGLVRYPNGAITLFQVNRQQTDAGDIDDTGLIVGSAFDPKANTDRLYATRVERKRCYFASLPRSKFLSPPGTEVFVTGVNKSGRVVGIAFVSGVGPHGFYKTLPP